MRLLFAAVSMLLVPVTAQAQIDAGNPLMPYMAHPQVWTVVEEEAAGDAAGEAADLAPSDFGEERTTPPRPARPVDFTYRADPARTKANVANYLGRIGAANPVAASGLRDQFASVDVIGAVGAQMRSAGLDPHNTADALAVWWVMVWSAANTVASPEDDGVYRAVSRQVRTGVADVPAAATFSDAQKQQFAEELMIQAALLDGMNDQFGGDPRHKAQVVDSARRSAAELGLDLATMTLTPDGFRPRKGAAGSAGEERLAAATAADANGSLAAYAAIAAAAGAGLGAAYWLGRGGRGG